MARGLKCLRYSLIAVGIICCLFVICAVVSIPISHYLVQQQVKDSVVIKNGSQVYDMWHKPTIPIYFQVYVFDLQNAAAVLSGERPIVKERGPYTYQEYREKVDIVTHENGTVSYREIKSYVFDRSMSIGPEEDNFTTVNIPLMAMAQSLSLSSWMKTAIDYLFRKKEPAFLTLTIHDILWGYQDPVLHYAKMFDKAHFTTDIVGAMAGKNNSDDGNYTVCTGEDDVAKVGMIDEYNGGRFLSFWSTSYANMINGTDGTVVHPFVEKSESIYLFSSDVCRSAPVMYNGTVVRHGIEVYRFTTPPAVYDSPDVNPDNAGFCTPAGNCLGAGVLNISNCQTVNGFSIPMVTSMPHFYMADAKYINQTIGMHPDPEQHNLHIDIEPLTGVIFAAERRIQINVHIEPVESFRDLRHIPEMIYPVFWINESAVLDEENAAKIGDQLRMIQMVHSVQYVGIAIACIVLIVVSLVSLGLCRAALARVPLHRSANDLLDERSPQPTYDQPPLAVFPVLIQSGESNSHLNQSGRRISDDDQSANRRDSNNDQPTEENHLINN